VTGAAVASGSGLDLAGAASGGLGPGQGLTAATLEVAAAAGVRREYKGRLAVVYMAAHAGVVVARRIAYMCLYTSTNIGSFTATCPFGMAFLILCFA
jgi:hypothetical protein